MYVYVYEKSGERLYVGRGHPLRSRVKSHYQESYKKAKDQRSAVWHEFFSKHTGKMTIYWKKLENEETRKAVEPMLDYVLKPKFDEFKKKYLIQRRKKEKPRIE